MKTDQRSAAAIIDEVAEALIVLDREGRCTYANHFAEHILGTDSNALIGRVLWEVVPTLARGRLRHEFLHAVDEQKPQAFEEYDEKEGKWWEWRLSPAPDGLMIQISDVSERKDGEEKSSISEQSYSQVVNSLGGIVWVADGRSFRFLYVSEQALSVLGYPIHQWLEEPDFWAMHLHSEDRRKCIRERRDAVRTGQTAAFEYRMIAVDGHAVWLREFSSPYEDENGRVLLRGTLLEISEQQRQEAVEHQRLRRNLEERVKEATALAGVTYLLQRSDLNLEQILRELVLLLPPALQYPEVAAARVSIDDLSVATPNFRETPAMIRAECRSDGSTSCVVEAAYLEDRPAERFGPFLAEERLLLQSIADLLKLAEDRRLALEALRQREEYFRTLVLRSKDCSAVVTEDGRIIYQSPSIERMVGYSPEELLGRTATELIHPEDATKWERFLQEVFAKSDTEARLTYRWRTRDEAWRVLESSGRRIVDERGQPAAVLTTRDVTERTEVEQRLRESEARFRLLFEKNAAGMLITDTDYHIWQANPAFCHMLGYTEVELMERGILEITLPEDREETIRTVDQMKATRQALELDKRYVHKGGTTIWVRVSAIPFDFDSRSTRCIATIQDITESKNAAEALRRSEQRYRSLFLASAPIVWVTDANGQVLPGNSTWCALTGQAEEECCGSGWLNAVHPEDRTRVALQWAESIEKKRIHETEMRVRTAVGEYRDFAVRGAPVWDDGDVREWVGTCTDITERNKAEAEVLTWKNRYDAAVRASRQLLYDWDMKGDAVIYGGNPEAILGLSLEELRGAGGVRRWTELIHPEDRTAFLTHVEQVLRSHQSFQVDYRLRQKDGSYRIVHDNGQCYLDERGNAFRLTGFVTDITERVESEQRLRASEERFRRIFQECGVGMFVIDQQGRFLQANPAYCKMLGYSEAEMLQMFERDVMHPDEVVVNERLLQEVFDGQRHVLDLDKRCVRKDGGIVWGHMTIVSTMAVGQPVYLIGVIQDITARKKAEEEVKRRDRFYRSLIENSSDNITVLDERGITLFQSPAIGRQLGYEPEELVGRNNAELIHPEDRPKATRKLLEIFHRGESKAPLILRFRTKKGALRILETVGKRFVNGDGKVVGIFNTRDVTERVIANELLQRAKQQAEAANLAKDRFLAALSHELRTPLTPVVALLPTLLQEPDLPAHMRSDLVLIKQSVELETRLIDDLLDLTRITQGKVHLNRQNIDAHEVIHATLEIVRSDLESKQITVELDLAAREHHIWADRVRILQVIWNLLKNAIKFSPPHSCITIRSENPQPGQIRVTVRDRGAGIEREQLPHIFDAFVQTLSGAGHQFGGLGLGLFISRAMVEQHAGKVEVESEGVGKGATFRISLATVTEGAAVEATPVRPTQAAANAPLRILLVEDHVDTREVLSRLLRRQGHIVYTAQSVAEALEVAERNPIEVVVSDLGLPDGSGLDLMSQLKSRYNLKGIAVSGYGMDADLKRSSAVGFDAHLVKPVDFKQLQAALQKVATA